MSTFEEHEAEQAEITALCEAGECDHPECHEHNFTFHIAMDIRAYGEVSVEAKTYEEAKAKVTAEYVAENFEPNGSGSDDLDFDHPREIFSMGAINQDTDEEFEDFDVPPGDWVLPDPARAALEQLLEQVYQMEKMFDDEDGTIARAIEEAENALS